MSTEEQTNTVEEEEIVSSGSKEKDRASKGVNSVTDYVEEKGGEGLQKAASALNSIGQSKETSVPAVDIKLEEEDVKLVMSSCELLKDAAERLLRAHNGNATDAMYAFVVGESQKKSTLKF